MPCEHGFWLGSISLVLSIRRCCLVTKDSGFEMIDFFPNQVAFTGRTKIMGIWRKANGVDFTHDRWCIWMLVLCMYW